MEQAYEKRNLKLADELLQKIDTMEKNLGPEYAALVDGLEIFDPEKDKLGAEIMLTRCTQHALYEVGLDLDRQIPAAATRVMRGLLIYHYRSLSGTTY